MSDSSNRPAAQAVFTPGPYERTHGDFVYALGVDAEGRTVNRMFLTIHPGWADGKRTAQPELNATAALLQAAPDLYEALRNLLHGCAFVLPGAAEQAKAALAKAEGRSDPKGPSAIPSPAPPETP